MPDSARKVLDLSYLASAADGDTEFIRSILDEYLQEMGSYLTQLKDSLERKDVALLLRAAHTMKGASANVGATRVSDTASHLETQARRGVLDGSQVLVALLGQEVARVRALIERQTVEELLRAG